MKKPAFPKGKTNNDKKKCSTKVKTRLPKICSKQVIPKYIIALRFLLKMTLIELEAFNLYGETCLHSTISTLSNQKKIRFHRKSEAHQHKNGGVTHFTRYTLFNEDHYKAEILTRKYGASNDG